MEPLGSDYAIILLTPRLQDAVRAHHERRRVVASATSPPRLRWWLAAAAALCLLLLSAAAKSARKPSESIGPVLSADQFREAFSGGAYEVEQAVGRDWTLPPVTSVQVRDRSNGRALVLVYPTVAATDAARLAAQRSGRASVRRPVTSVDAGPQLVVGYGTSVWAGNVAMVQTTPRALEHLYGMQIDRDNGSVVAEAVIAEATAPDTAVDSDFRLALEKSVVSL